MMFHVVLLVFAQAIFIQSISGQCIGLAPPVAAASCACAGPWASGPYGLGASNAINLVASNGGGLAISSASPLAPNGVSIVSENAIEGALGVYGALPFLGTVALEGVLPTAGAGAVAYGCGNGEVAILSEDLSGLSGGALAYEAGALGYGAGALPYGANLGRSPYGYSGISSIGGCGCGLRI